MTGGCGDPSETSERVGGAGGVWRVARRSAAPGRDVRPRHAGSRCGTACPSKATQAAQTQARVCRPRTAWDSLAFDWGDDGTSRVPTPAPRHSAFVRRPSSTSGGGDVTKGLRGGARQWASHDGRDRVSPRLADVDAGRSSSRARTLGVGGVRCVGG